MPLFGVFNRIVQQVGGYLTYLYLIGLNGYAIGNTFIVVNEPDVFIARNGYLHGIDQLVHGFLNIKFADVGGNLPGFNF